MSKNDHVFNQKTTKLFVVSAPSGGGKTTIVNQAIEQLRRERVAIERVVTYATKTPHEDELNHGDYHFISVAEFERKIKQEFFLEWSVAYGTYYGSPRSIISDELDISHILILDRAGWRSLLQEKIPAVSIWLEPPNMASLRARLVKRNRDSLEQIEKRLKLAQQELAEEQKEQLYQYHLINNNFSYALVQFLEILRSELSA